MASNPNVLSFKPSNSNDLEMDDLNWSQVIDALNKAIGAADRKDLDMTVDYIYDALDIVDPDEEEDGG